jgi:hypothetical protein
MAHPHVAVAAQSRAGAIFAAVDGEAVPLADGTPATVRLLSVYQAARRWWIQYELVGGERWFGLVSAGSHDPIRVIRRRIAHAAHVSNTTGSLM